MKAPFPNKGHQLSSSTRQSCLRTRLFLHSFIYLFIWGFYVAFNTVQVISRRVVRRAEETSTYSWSRFCTVNCRPVASNFQPSHLRPCWEPNPSLRGGRRECYHSATVALVFLHSCESSVYTKNITHHFGDITGHLEIYPFHTTGGITQGNPRLGKCPHPWITV